MPYKDKETQRKAVKEAVKKHRKGITSGGITEQGITRIEFIQDALRIRDGEGKILNEHFINEIEAAAKRLNDREARYERAYHYFRWRNGEVIEPTIPFALVYDRARLEKVYQSLKDFKQETDVYYGCGKDSVPFDVVGELLEATA